MITQGLTEQSVGHLQMNLLRQKEGETMERMDVQK
jgi:hypothetical protein